MRKPLPNPLKDQTKGYDLIGASSLAAIGLLATTAGITGASVPVKPESSSTPNPAGGYEVIEFGVRPVDPSLLDLVALYAPSVSVGILSLAFAFLMLTRARQLSEKAKRRGFVAAFSASATTVVTPLVCNLYFTLSIDEWKVQDNLFSSLYGLLALGVVSVASEQQRRQSVEKQLEGVV